VIARASDSTFYLLTLCALQIVFMIMIIGLGTVAVQCIVHPTELSALSNVDVAFDKFWRRLSGKETQLSLTNRATRLEVSQCHRTWYNSIC